jgi:hypothetical protein
MHRHGVPESDAYNEETVQTQSASLDIPLYQISALSLSSTGLDQNGAWNNAGGVTAKTVVMHENQRTKMVQYKRVVAFTRDPERQGSYGNGHGMSSPFQQSFP